MYLYNSLGGLLLDQPFAFCEEQEEQVEQEEQELEEQEELVELVEEAEQDKDHASVVPVPGNNANNKSSIKIEAGELDDYMNDFQERIETIGCKTDNMVTIVQNNGESKVVTSPGHHPVIVTVSGSLDSDSVIKSPEMDILAHL